MRKLELDGQEYIEQLRNLRCELAVAAREFLDEHSEEVEAYRAEISRGVVSSLERLRAEVSQISGGNSVCEQLAEQAAQYVEWLQWTFWDLPYFAVAVRPARERFGEAVASCGLVYLSMRVFDDVLDRHFWYKGKRPTLLSAISESHANSRGTEYLTVLAGLLLCFDGLMMIVNQKEDGSQERLKLVTGSIRRAIIGAMMEQTPSQEWDQQYYDRLIQLKNVDYWRSLYASIDPKQESPLYPFLEQYYALAQMLNDVQDYPQDERQGQPNLISLHLRRDPRSPSPCLPRDDSPTPLATPEIERLLARQFLDLGEIGSRLPLMERRIALLKLGESLDEAYRLGLFDSRPESQPDDAAAEQISLHWMSGIDEVIERAGPAGLEVVDCEVCGSSRRKEIFKKHGFPYHRCLECSHIYVSPRVTAQLQGRIGSEMDEADKDSEFLNVQRAYAGLICELLHARTSGPRLLDVGFGAGHIMQTARAYGFESYGIDSSRAEVDNLWPFFGRHVHQGVLGAEPIPWGAFDVVVMSHILEHLADPALVLKEVLKSMRPGGLLYVAVPNTDSFQFKLFGKNWDVFNPMVHLQYFNEASLRRLLLDCGFINLEKIDHPPLPPELTPRWLEMFRRFGGNDSGELDMLAQRPL